MRLFLAALLLAGCAHQRPPEPEPEKPHAPSLAGSAISKLLLPPAEVGAHRFAVEGCAAKPDEADKPPTRGGLQTTADTVEASAVRGGVVLSHEVGHACCLSAATAVQISGNTVTITETLSGTQCRCLCSSNLRTAVGLSPGTWSVEVNTVSPGKTWSAWSGELIVPGA